MTACLFASDLHGRIDRYQKLVRAIQDEQPAAVFLGGDLLPPAFAPSETDWVGDGFVHGVLGAAFGRLREEMGQSYPDVFIILGNDDPRLDESSFLDVAVSGLWTYLHDRSAGLHRYRVYGYAYVPPSPFRLKDWERYDVSRYVDPGCVSPEEGAHTVPVPAHVLRHATIEHDLRSLVGDDDVTNAVFLFHTPPYQTKLDRADLDGEMIDHAPLDVHIGSIAVKRFIEEKQPLITLHGHVHESARLTGSWRDRIGRTHLFSAAHDGPELSLVRFDLDAPGLATRVLL